MYNERITSPNKTKRIFTRLSVLGNVDVSIAAVTLFLSNKEITIAATNKITNMKNEIRK